MEYFKCWSKFKLALLQERRYENNYQMEHKQIIKFVSFQTNVSVRSLPANKSIASVYLPITSLDNEFRRLCYFLLRKIQTLNIIVQNRSINVWLPLNHVARAALLHKTDRSPCFKCVPPPLHIIIWTSSWFVKEENEAQFEWIIKNWL